MCFCLAVVGGIWLVSVVSLGIATVVLVAVQYLRRLHHELPGPVDPGFLEPFQSQGCVGEEIAAEVTVLLVLASIVLLIVLVIAQARTIRQGSRAAQATLDSLLVSHERSRVTEESPLVVRHE